MVRIKSQFYRLKRKKKPAFTKNYYLTSQDEMDIERIDLLQKIHSKIAKTMFGKIKNYKFGEWMTKFDGVVLFIDPELGMQAELEGTSKMSLSERLKVHLRFLKLLRKGCCILKAVKLCHSMLMKQSTS